MKDKELKPNANSNHQTLTSNVAITLIALVITIIVMLILVGVSVSIVINGGLFSTAKKAVTKTEEAKDSELRFMAMANAATHDKLWTYTSKDGKTIPIPAGFAPTEIEGETSLDKGFVIIDAEGNEFVWIPCESVDNYNNATFSSNTDWSAYQWEYNNKTWTDGEENIEVNGEKKTVSEIKSKSVNTNKGFYVARYEAGVPGEIESFSGTQEEYIYYLGKEKNTDKYKPVSKKGYPAWNFISQKNAVEVSKAMYANNSTVNSYLIDSHAWNYICKNILGSKDKGNKNITNSTDWGNYKDNTTTKYENLEVLYAVHEYNNKWIYAKSYSKGLIPNEARTGNNRLELATGASDDFKAYNIYDMAGNMWEWTTETGKMTNGTNSSTTYAAIRGGSFDHNGSSKPVVHARGDFPVDHSYVSIGFRVVLYL